MANDLVAPGDLSYLPGAPFTEGEVDAAAAAIRTALEWHVAPQHQETVVFDVGSGQRRLTLPTRKLLSVDEVRAGGVTVGASSYQVSIGLGQVVKQVGCWPAGFGTVEVDITHGFDSVPDDLLPVIAATATSQRLLAVRAPVIENPSQIGEGVGANVVAAGPLTARPLGRDALMRYSLRWLPGLA
ncbi:hypothetical protein [Mycolicibacterium mageritense]|uniref:hypothetical protein n=1 Tax=Mycolicibacterium mageritense TaxID=53462 RepID=UPI001E47DE40|nr:hypothetical protein [Mycolicibacterium mageritense]GJJ22286.1 hypothetical protein MTY414_59590 [Mycolicibacterium mageritense]